MHTAKIDGHQTERRGPSYTKRCGTTTDKLAIAKEYGPSAEVVAMGLQETKAH